MGLPLLPTILWLSSRSTGCWNALFIIMGILHYTTSAQGIYFILKEVWQYATDKRRPKKFKKNVKNSFYVQQYVKIRKKYSSG